MMNESREGKEVVDISVKPQSHVRATSLRLISVC